MLTMKAKRQWKKRLCKEVNCLQKRNLMRDNHLSQNLSRSFSKKGFLRSPPTGEYMNSTSYQIFYLPFPAPFSFLPGFQEIQLRSRITETENMLQLTHLYILNQTCCNKNVDFSGDV